MEFVRDDFKEMRHNVYDLKDNAGLKKFPELNMRKIDRLGVTDFRLIKFIAFLYDPKSPLMAEADIRKRRILAGTIAGFPKTGNKFKKEYRDIVMFSREVIVPLMNNVVMYCRVLRGQEYSQLAVYTERVVAFTKTLRDEDDAKASIDLLRVIEQLNKNISELKEKFLNGDDTEESIEELEAVLEFDGMEFSPEQIAFSLEVRDNIKNGSPYGKWKYRGYTIEDLTDDELEQFELQKENKDKEAQNQFKALGFSTL